MQEFAVTFPNSTHRLETTATFRPSDFGLSLCNLSFDQRSRHVVFWAALSFLSFLFFLGGGGCKKKQVTTCGFLGCPVLLSFLFFSWGGGCKKKQVTTCGFLGCPVLLSFLFFFLGGGGRKKKHRTKTGMFWETHLLPLLVLTRRGRNAGENQYW